MFLLLKTFFLIFLNILDILQILIFSRFQFLTLVSSLFFHEKILFLLFILIKILIIIL